MLMLTLDTSGKHQVGERTPDHASMVATVGGNGGVGCVGVGRGELVVGNSPDRGVACFRQRGSFHDLGGSS